MKAIILSLFLVFCLAITASAQTEEQVLPAQLKMKTVVTEPPTLYKGFAKATLTYIWFNVAKYFDSNGKLINTPGSSYGTDPSLDLELRYGITSRLTVHVDLPYEFFKLYGSMEGRYNLKDSVFVERWKRKGYGLGDFTLGADYQVIKENEGAPSLTLKSTLTLPTGRKNPTNVINAKQYDESTGEGEYQLNEILQCRKVAFPFSYDLSAYFTYYSQGSKQIFPGESETTFKGGNLWQGSATMGYQVNDWICLNNIIIYNFKQKTTYDDPSYQYLEYSSQSLNYGFFVYWQIRRLRFLQFVMVPVWGKYTSADPLYTIMLSYAF